MFKVPKEVERIKTGPYGSKDGDGCSGAFKFSRGRSLYWIIISDGLGWEHVSVHAVSDGEERTPTWAEMCMIKDMFWDEEDCVIQYHPSKSEYVNMHKHVLHLWRPIGIELPIPNKLMVGV